MTPHDWALLAVDLVKALAWPLAVGAIAWRLGPGFLEALRGRSVKVEGFGASITVEQQVTSPDNPINGPGLDRPARPPAVVLRETVQLLEQRIKADLAQYAQADREPALINALAAARVAGTHEFHYNRIFGSQIAGLRLLDERGSATVAEARTFFEPYARQYPQVYSTYGFDGWLGFMLKAKLVDRTGDRLTTTPYGHDFLVYLREVRLTEIKPG
jgi:hypothetical protein